MERHSSIGFMQQVSREHFLLKPVLQPTYWWERGLLGRLAARGCAQGSASPAKMTFGIFLAFHGMSGLVLKATFNELHRWERRPVFPPNFSVCRFWVILVSYDQ